MLRLLWSLCPSCYPHPNAVDPLRATLCISPYPTARPSDPHAAGSRSCPTSPRFYPGSSPLSNDADPPYSVCPLPSPVRDLRCLVPWCPCCWRTVRHQLGSVSGTLLPLCSDPRWANSFPHCCPICCSRGLSTPRLGPSRTPLIQEYGSKPYSYRSSFHAVHGRCSATAEQLINRRRKPGARLSRQSARGTPPIFDSVHAVRPEGAGTGKWGWGD